MRKLYSVYYSSIDPFGIFGETTNVKHPNQLTKDGALLLHGGGDISPSIYNQEPNSHCHAGNRPSQRDLEEIEFVNQALKMELPIIGICRGAQLLCALDGGYLIQHINGHTCGEHTITDVRTGEYFKSTSAHHQMMVPVEKHSVVLAIHPGGLRGVDENDKEVPFKYCPEIVLFPRMRGIGIQGHPEWSVGSNFNHYCASLINEFLLKD